MRPTVLALITVHAAIAGSLVLGCTADNPDHRDGPDLAAQPDLSGASIDLPFADLVTPADLTEPTDLTEPVDFTSNGGVGAHCGGLQGKLCAAALYCDFPKNCGIADELGTCAEKPQVCPKIFDPVCGCDNRQYGNDCMRQAAGVSLLDHGICGCPKRCGAGNYCADCKGGPTCLKKGQSC